MDVIDKYSGEYNIVLFEDIDYNQVLVLISRVSWNGRFVGLLSLASSFL